MSEIRRKPLAGGVNIGLYEGDSRLAGLVLFDLTIRVGDCAVRCGCIGGVGTEPQYRGNGYARLVMEDALAYMRESGMLLGALFGIPNFYPKWGFASVLVEGTLEIETAHALQAPAPLSVRAMRPEDIAAVIELYTRENAQRSGTIVRRLDEWKGFRYGVSWNDNVAAYVVEDAGQVVGYAAYNSEPWHTQVAEISGSREALQSLVHRFGESAHERCREKITFRLPPDHALVRLSAGLGCRLIVEYPHAGDGMARIIDQPGLLQTLTPLFAKRLAASPVSDWCGTLVFETQLGTDAVSLGGTQTHVVRLAQEQLIQLILGYRSVADLAFEGQVECAPELMPILDAVMPRGLPYMWHPDRF